MKIRRVMLATLKSNKMLLLQTHPNQMPQPTQLVVKTPQLNPTLHRLRIQQRTQQWTLLTSPKIPAWLIVAIKHQQATKLTVPQSLNQTQQAINLHN